MARQHLRNFFKFSIWIHMIEVQDDWVILSAISTRFPRQIFKEQRSNPYTMPFLR